MIDTVDKEYMRRALRLAEKGRGYTSPNPMVGAVLVKGGVILGEGYHRAAGEDHAEIAAIKNSGDSVHGATLYVTLEPCCHTGRTGPCSEEIVKAGIKRVVYAVKDPNPKVNGKSARWMREAGLLVEGGVLGAEARQLNDHYFGYLRNGRPFVVLKTAQTLDGRVATRSGDSKWISGPESLKFAHRLRRDVDAVVVGMGTVRQDNPSLTVRLVKGRNPYRIVVSASLKFRRKCQLLDENHDYRTILATTAAAGQRFSRAVRGRNLIFWDLRTNRDGFVNVNDLLRKADDFGIRSLLIEGGATLATSFLRAGIVDKCIVITAPLIVGTGVNAVGDIGVRRLLDGIHFDRYSFQLCGGDSVFIGYPRKGGQQCSRD